MSSPKSISEGWADYLSDVSEGQQLSGDSIRLLRSTYYAGAMNMVQTLCAVAVDCQDRVGVSEKLNALLTELEQYGREVELGR